MTAQDIAALFESLELELVESLHRSLTRHQKQEQTEGGKNGTPQHWEAWQAAKLRDIRRFRRENTAILGEYRDRIDAGTRALLEEEAAQGGTDGFFRMDDTRMTALLNEMQQANEQSERAALRYMNDVYRKTILRTAAAMQAGGQTLQQAADAATRDFLEQGIACIRYRDGRRVNISTYAEMALRTAGTRAMLMGEAAQRERLGIDTVLVSQYGACSKTCLPWQGLIYIDDVFQQYSGPHTPGGTYGISRNGRQYPLLSVAMRGGLFHPNCRHTLSTWVEGTSTRPRPMDKARVEAVARLETRQRALERNVRKAKRRAAGLCDPDAIKAARASVRTAQKELRDFVAAHGDVLRRDAWRERDVAINRANNLARQDDALYNQKKEETLRIIRSEGTIKRLNIGNQRKHIRESGRDIGNRSFLYGDLEDAQSLVNQYSGTGNPKFDRKGNWTHKEHVVADHLIGEVVTPETGKSTPTHRFSIHYGKNGTHIVPAKEENPK